MATRTATLQSSPAVRARLRAALYYARQRRIARLGVDEPFDPPATALEIDELPFDGYVFDMAGQTSGVAVISGTGHPAEAITVRAASAGGNLGWQATTIAGDGTWSVSLPVSSDAQMANWYTPEARYGTHEVSKVTGTNTFGYGDVLGLLGQSELEYILSNASFYNTNYTRSLDVANLSVVLASLDDGSDITPYRLAAGTVSNANVGCVALANLHNHVRPGRKLMIADGAYPGTSPRALANDADTSRNWSTLQSVADLVRAGGSDFGAFIPNWYNSPASTIPTMTDDWAAFLFGQNSAGVTFTLGTAGPGPVWTDVVDHCLYDLDAPLLSRGRGLLARGRTTLYLMQPMPFSDSDDTEDNSYDETLRISNSSRAGVLALAATSQFQSVGRLMPSTNLCDFGGGIHPLTTDVFGVPHFAMLHGPATLSAAGVTVEEPMLLSAEATGANTVEMTVNLPNGGNLTTIREFAGIADPVSPPPHYQDVVGFQVNRGGTKRPIYDVGEITYPSEYRGTVTITDSGTGTAPNRTGKVLITLTDNVVTGDLITYVDGQGTAILKEDRDVPAQLFLNMLIEHVPAWYDDTALYPFYGVPVRPQTVTDALVGEALPVAEYATRGLTDDAYLLGPNLAAGVKAITYVLDADIPDNEGGNFELMEVQSTTFWVRADLRSAKRSLSITVEELSGTKVFNTVVSANGVYQAGRRTLTVSTSLDSDGSGAALLKAWVDDTLVIDATATSSDKVFVTRFPEFFRAVYALNVYSVKVYAGAHAQGFTSDGDVSGLTLLHSVEGAAANWNTPGGTLTKLGVDDFT